MVPGHAASLAAFGRRGRGASPGCGPAVAGRALADPAIGSKLHGCAAGGVSGAARLRRAMRPVSRQKVARLPLNTTELNDRLHPARFYTLTVHPKFKQIPAGE
jgi:hypothetical protein